MVRYSLTEISDRMKDFQGFDNCVAYRRIDTEKGSAWRVERVSSVGVLCLAGLEASSVDTFSKRLMVEKGDIYTERLLRKGYLVEAEKGKVRVSDLAKEARYEFY